MSNCHLCSCVMPTSVTTCATCLAELENAWDKILAAEGLPAELPSEGIAYVDVDPEQLAS